MGNSGAEKGDFESQQHAAQSIRQPVHMINENGEVSKCTQPYFSV
jgi:hypothetical protein